jgi:NADH:ubiquinone oxidoreductase subunit 5 (subunit L)/multisubunit Na+/H+ antiporter MnhA subunit
MEAPVPASALIHSATLVSAGIFLLLRFNVFFDYSVISIFLISMVGSFTAFYGGFVSMYQSDTKKILAYSTISHCGFLMVLVSLNIVEFTLLYLYIHGFFKAAVFMCVGNVNRLNKNNQDFKQMGMYYKYLPFDCFLSCIGLINLAGLPFSLGFYIKHLLFLSLHFNIYVYYFILLNCLGGALSGLFYCSRLIINIFFDFKKSRVGLYSIYNRKNLNSNFYSNTNLISNFSIFFLFFFSYFFGFYFLHLYLSKIMNYSDLVSFLQTSNYYFIYISNSHILSNIGLLN